MRRNISPVYSSKILKAGALLSDTRTMLAHWDLFASRSQNVDRFKRDNIFGKASRSRVEDILRIFQQRYLNEPAVARALVCMVESAAPVEAVNAILFFHSAQADPLLHDFVTEVLLPLRQAGLQEVTARDAEGWIEGKVAGGRTHSQWSASTIKKAATGLLSALRDFGVLEGARNKRLAPVYLPISAFAYLAFYLGTKQPSGLRLVEDAEWRLFFLGPREVERMFMEAHQLRLLDYQAAGSVVRVNFPSKSLEEYVHVIFERAH